MNVFCLWYLDFILFYFVNLFICRLKNLANFISIFDVFLMYFWCIFNVFFMKLLKWKIQNIVFVCHNSLKNISLISIFLCFYLLWHSFKFLYVDSYFSIYWFIFNCFVKIFSFSYKITIYSTLKILNTLTWKYHKMLIFVHVNTINIHNNFFFRVLFSLNFIYSKIKHFFIYSDDKI
jgi:hypothetical protein